MKETGAGNNVDDPREISGSSTSSSTSSTLPNASTASPNEATVYTSGALLSRSDNGSCIVKSLSSTESSRSSSSSGTFSIVSTDSLVVVATTASTSSTTPVSFSSTSIISSFDNDESASSSSSTSTSPSTSLFGTGDIYSSSLAIAYSDPSIRNDAQLSELQAGNYSSTIPEPDLHISSNVHDGLPAIMERNPRVSERENDAYTTPSSDEEDGLFFFDSDSEDELSDNEIEPNIIQYDHVTNGAQSNDETRISLIDNDEESRRSHGNHQGPSVSPRGSGYASVYDTIPGTSDNDPIPGTSDNDRIPGTSDNDPIPGTSTNHSFPGTSSQDHTQDAFNNDLDQGTPNHNRIPGTSDNDPFPGISSQDPIPGTSSGITRGIKRNREALDSDDPVPGTSNDITPRPKRYRTCSPLNRGPDIWRRSDVRPGNTVLVPGTSTGVRGHISNRAVTAAPTHSVNTSAIDNTAVPGTSTGATTLGSNRSARGSNQRSSPDKPTCRKRRRDAGTYDRELLLKMMKRELKELDSYYVCPADCPCKMRGAVRKPTRTERRFRVTEPLYMKVLKSRSLEPVYQADIRCCDRYCCLKWYIDSVDSGDVWEDY